jgi:DHA1 family bicyclomycin/chloramphenicol resistance-like MFS transporter
LFTKSTSVNPLIPRKVATWLLVVTMGCGTAGITIISPALNSITKYFSVDEAAAQSLLSGYFIAMAVSQLIYGPLSDRYGRRRPLLVGLVGFALGGLLAASAESFEVLVLARVLQGLGAASIASIIRAIINDSYGRLEAAGAFATISGIMVIVPIFSFAFGGLISDLIGWKGIMFGIFFAGLIPLALNFIFLPETNLRPISQIRLGSLAHDHLSLMTNRVFLTFMIASSCSAGIFFSMIGFVPFEYVRIGVDTSEVGLWFMLIPFGYTFGNFLTKRFVHRIGIERMSQIGGLISMLAMSALLLPSLLGWKHPIMIAVPCFFFGFSSGFVIANATMGAIASAGKLGGSASGIVGAVQMGFGVLGGSLVVSVGGYEHFESGVLVLIGLAALSTLSSTLAQHFSKTLPLVEPLEQEAS